MPPTTSTRAPRLPLRAVAGLLALACWGLSGCGVAEPPQNVLLITLDTTRADRLGCYGYERGETPTIDALARDGVRFERAYAHAPLTLASHATMLTGLHAREHGVHVNGGGRLATGIPTLAEALHDKGYRTGAFVASFVLDEVFGLGRGFDRYDDTMGADDRSRRFESERPADRVTDAALEWLADSDDRPFFAWVHYYDPHSGYDPPAEYKERFDDPYDGEIAFVDAQLARILSHLDREGLRDSTLIVVAGDHGEAFGEHGEKDHGLFIYDTTMHVPLIISGVSGAAGPRSGTTFAAPVGLLDLYPTVIELTGAESGARTSGRSLVPALRGESVDSTLIYAESRWGQVGYGWAPLRSIVDGDLKYIEAPVPELYDLRADPAEEINLAGELGERARDLQRALRMFERRHEPTVAETVDLDGEAMAQLRSLGYVGGTHAAGIDLDADTSGLRDPKEMLEVYLGHLRAIRLLGRRQYAEAADLLEELLERSPESLDLYENLGTCYLALGRAEQAEDAYRKSLTRIPRHAERLWGLGEALRRQNRHDDAIAAYEAALTYRPALGEAHMALGQIYFSRGDRQKALHHATRHADINPGSTVALGNLTEIAFAAQDLDLALVTVERWIAADGRDAHNARWQMLNGAKRRQDAIDALRKSVAVFPDDWDMFSTLAWLIATTPDQPAASVDEALQLAEAAVSRNPDNPRSYDVLAAAEAAGGDFEAAVRAAEAGIARADAADAPRARAAIESRLNLYRSGRPYRK